MPPPRDRLPRNRQVIKSDGIFRATECTSTSLRIQVFDADVGVIGWAMAALYFSEGAPWDGTGRDGTGRDGAGRDGTAALYISEGAQLARDDRLTAV